jgi:NACalpha-BTF3-like transcription factor
MKFENYTQTNKFLKNIGEDKKKLPNLSAVFLRKKDKIIVFQF